jgi:lipopolysaccharide export LptBFGC system permease protein LptF
MIRTLQLYVSRELFKTFALTAVGLTLTFALSGGVLQMAEAEVLSSVQMARMLLFILPVALTLTLPVAALFACAIVYGRLAADNEIDACKASGINIHRLLPPAIALSLLTGGFTFGFINYVLPRFVEEIDALVRKDLDKVVLHAFNTRGYAKPPGGGFIIHARRAGMLGEQDGVKMMYLQNGAFVEMEGERVVRAGTAQEIRVDFSTSPLGNPLIQAAMYDIRALDLRQHRFYEEREQPFRSMEIPSAIRHDPKWLTLPQLIHFRDNLAELPTIRNQVSAIRMQIRDAVFYRHVLEELKQHGVLRLADANHEYEIRAERMSQSPEDMRPELEGVEVRARSGPVRRDYTAERASLRVKRGFVAGGDMVQMFLRGQVTFRDAREPATVVEPKDVDLEEVALPAEFVEVGLTDAEILGIGPAGEKPNWDELVNVEPESLGFGSRIQNARVATRKSVVGQGLKINGVIHSRLAFSASTLVTLLLAAGLGIIFRGGQLLTAFVISFIPGLLVVVMNIMGRQLAEHADTVAIGVGIIWGAIALVALADVVVLTKFLRR